MDNVTHSLIGLMTGEAWARAAPGRDSTLSAARRRGLIVALAIVANNLPDLDLLYSYPGKLRYLLQHRGYTHTVVGCALLALLLYAAVAAWLAKRRLPMSRADHVSFVGVTLLGVALHLGMDAMNSYGVHPFWPFDNRWIYGDSIFIVEPLYWAAAAPLLCGLQTRTARIVLGVLLAMGVALCWASGMVATPIPLLFTALVILLLAAGRRVGPRAAAFMSVALFAAVTLIFMAAGRAAVMRVEAAARVQFPRDRILDHVLNPMPVNPLCWEVLLLQVRDARYYARHAALSLAPRLMPAAACGRGFLTDTPRFPQVPLPVFPGSQIEWREFSMPRGLLADLAAAHCDAAALLRFARAPFALAQAGGWTLGDLRFERGATASSFEIGTGLEPDAKACSATPPWVPPREDLLAR